MSGFDDGILDHPDANPSCPICGGGGLLDTACNFGCILVPCVCTGRADLATIVNVQNSYPGEYARLIAMTGAVA